MLEYYKCGPGAVMRFSLDGGWGVEAELKGMVDCADCGSLEAKNKGAKGYQLNLSQTSAAVTRPTPLRPLPPSPVQRAAANANSAAGPKESMLTGRGSAVSGIYKFRAKDWAEFEPWQREVAGCMPVHAAVSLLSQPMAGKSKLLSAIERLGLLRLPGPSATGGPGESLACTLVLAASAIRSSLPTLTVALPDLQIRPLRRRRWHLDLPPEWSCHCRRGGRWRCPLQPASPTSGTPQPAKVPTTGQAAAWTIHPQHCRRRQPWPHRRRRTARSGFKRRYRTDPSKWRLPDTRTRTSSESSK